jgi:hypothetical protein
MKQAAMVVNSEYPIDCARYVWSDDSVGCNLQSVFRPVAGEHVNAAGPNSPGEFDIMWMVPHGE